MKDRKIAILSDLHLHNTDPLLIRKFSGLLKEFKANKFTDLWLLGDIFDLLIGDYTFWAKKYPEIFNELKALSKNGCQILWCEGNHDFHIKNFLENYGIEVFDNERSFYIDEGKKIHLAHGDLVNTNDAAYLKWRAFTRNPVFRKSLDFVPQNIAKIFLLPLAEKVSYKSRHSTKRDDVESIKKLYRQNADKLFSQGFDAVFMGHCHVQDLYEQSGKFYLNLGSALDGTLRYAEWIPSSQAFPNVLTYSKI